jgi:ABC-2 type transport system permease protein
MKTLIEKVRSWRIWPLFMKELRQIIQDKKLIVSLILPPTVQLIIFGLALNPDVTNLRLGVVDESRTAASREVVSAFVESRSFQVSGYYSSPDELSRALSTGKLDAGLIVPSDFARRRERRETARVQLLLDAVDSNTAGIAQGYAARIITALNQRLAPHSGQESVALQTEGSSSRRGSIAARIALLYNPGLESSWFIVTGVLGILLVLNGSIIGSASMVKEKELGTVEQLLMTPAQASEIIAAKIGPLCLLLSIDIALALGVGYVVFGVPVRGSLLLICSAGMLCIFAGIGIGTFLATFSRSQQQAQLMSFFVNPPLSMLSGATTPIEAMPEWMQPLTLLNPIRHFSTIARVIMLKGAGIDVLYPNLLALLCFAVALVGVSAWRFRKQLG